MIVSRRSVAAGGTSIISVDGHVPPPFQGVTGGNPRWLTDTLLIAQTIRDINGVTQARLETWDYDNPTAPLALVSHAGMNFMFAGGGQWAAWVGHYYDSHGFKPNVDQSDWAPLAVDDTTGLIAVILKRSQGSGLGIWDGTDLLIIESGPVDPEASFKNKLLLYKVPGQHFGMFRFWSASPNVIGPPSQVPVRGVCQSNGYRLGSQDDKGILIYGWDGTTGLQIHTPGQPFDQDFDFDMYTRDDGTIMVVSSRGAGNNPDDLQIYICNPQASTVNGEPRPWLNLFPVEPPIPPIEPPIPPVEPPIPPEPPEPEPEMPATPKNREHYENALADCGVKYLRIGEDDALTTMTRQELWQGIHEEGDRYQRTPELSWSGRAMSLSALSRDGAETVTVTQSIMDPWFDETAEIDAVELQRG